MRSGLGLPERRLKMLMKIRSARLYFSGNLIYFSCTTVSLTPVFQVLGRRKLCVSVLGLAWPRSDLLSPGPHRAVLAGRTQALRDGSRAELLGAAGQVPWCGSGWEHRPETSGMGSSPPFLCPGECPPSPKSQHELYSTPHGVPVAKSCFFFQNNPSPEPRRGLRGAQEIYC